MALNLGRLKVVCIPKRRCRVLCMITRRCLRLSLINQTNVWSPRSGNTMNLSHLTKFSLT